MKFVIVNILVLLTVSLRTNCQIPNVYEFCNALLEDKRPVQPGASCQTQCQGRPGKIGPPGVRGPQGIKGDQGIQGTCDGLKERQRLFEVEMKKKFELIPKLIYCGMGMKNNDIPDESITASSYYDHRFLPSFGRLDSRQILSGSTIITSGAWCAKTASVGEWIEVDLGSPKLVAGIITHGRPKNPWDVQCWVKTFKMSCGLEFNSYSTLMENGSEKVFSGNVDMETHAVNKFISPLTCRYLRVYPLTWNTVSPWVRPCLRIELIRGECHDMY